jgi:hypothetical protein
MAAQGAEEMLAELETVAAGESATSATGKTGETKTSGKPDGDWIPKSRLNEVIQARNERDQTIATLSSKIAESDASVTRLTKMLEGAQNAQTTLNDLRALANDPKHRPHVEYLHKVMIGESVEEEAVLPEDATPVQIEEHKLNELARAQEELRASVVDQRADHIIQRADLIADRWLEALPAEYTAEDRNAVAHLWTSRVDWNAIEGNPSGLEQFLADSFQNTLNIYGVPRGYMYTPEQVEELKTQTTGESAPVTPEEMLAQLLTSKNYGGFKSSGKKNSAGAEIMLPEVSEDDFAADLATAMKISNASRRK